MNFFHNEEWVGRSLLVGHSELKQINNLYKGST